jgi:hypothetical protein
MVRDIESLQRERFALFKAGMSPVDWMQLTPWQRRDILTRHQLETKQRADKANAEGLKGLLALVIQRVLGV